MLRSQTKTLSSNGLIMKPFELPKIEFEVRYPSFPTYLGSSSIKPDSNNNTGGSGSLRITTSVQNTVYIDFGDGSEIYSRDFNGQTHFAPASAIHEYTDGVKNHIVKIWFKLPSKITAINFYIIDVFGEVPKALSMYPLNILEFIRTKFLEPPHDYGATFLYKFVGSYGFQTAINYIPEFIGKSSITDLRLGSGFNLRNTNSTNIDILKNVKNLTYLSFGSGTNLDDVGYEMRNYPNLRYLNIGGQQTYFTQMTENLNQCRQLTHLAFGYVSHHLFGITESGAASLMTSWGVGFYGMSNLIYLSFANCPGVQTTIPLGLEDLVNVKTLIYNSSLDSSNGSNRGDSLVESYYNFVIENASMSLGNTKFRQIRLEMYGSLDIGVMYSPSGTYQAPEGYVQGESNGTPASPMEMMYVLVKQYRWTILASRLSLNNTRENITYAP